MTFALRLLLRESVVEGGGGGGGGGRERERGAKVIGGGEIRHTEEPWRHSTAERPYLQAG